LALLGVSVAVAAAVPTASAAKITTVSASQTRKATALLPALASAQSSADQLPAYLQSGPESFDGIDPATSRSLGSDQGVSYWSAQNTNGQLCMIALLPGISHIATDSCGTTAAIQQQGLGMQFTNADGSLAVNAYLLPPGYRAAAPYRTISTQLVVGDARTQHAPSISTSSATAATAGASRALQPVDLGLASTNSN
jgi:hypothetical protein